MILNSQVSWEPSWNLWLSASSSLRTRQWVLYKKPAQNKRLMLVASPKLHSIKGVLTFLQQALKEYSPDEANVLRSGLITRVHASELVPGDIICIAVGDKIPTDCRLLSISSSGKSIEAISNAKAMKQDQHAFLCNLSSQVLLANISCIWNVGHNSR